MKRSQAIRLTVVAAMGAAARAQDPASSATPAAPATTCEQRRKAAKAAGSPFSEVCGKVRGGAHGTVRGGFGIIGGSHSGGG